MKKKVISMFLTACTVSVMVVGGGSNLVMADDAETVTLMGWYDEDDMNPILEKVNEQMDGKYVIEYTYVANTDYNNVLSTQLASGEGPDIIMDGTNYPAEIKAGNVEDISDYDFVKEYFRDPAVLIRAITKYKENVKTRNDEKMLWNLLRH